MDNQRDNLDVRLDDLLSGLRQRQDRALAGVDLAAQRRAIMAGISASPTVQPMRPLVIRLTFGAMAAAAAGVLLTLAIAQFFAPPHASVQDGSAVAQLAKPQELAGEAVVSVSLRAADEIADAGDQHVHYRRIRDFEQGLMPAHSGVAQAPAGSVLMVGVAQGRGAELPFFE